jgi:diphthamide synthase (EF-2-diphthine--ammonia ligase)
MKRRTLLSWSSGKDSAWTLHVLRQRPDIEVVGLFTTINEAADRAAMHAVRRSLVARQARAVGLPIDFIPLPHPCPNAAYEAAMNRYVQAARA